MWGGIKGYARDAAKTALFAVMGNGWMLRKRLETVRKAGVTTILNLHRVAPDDGSDYRPLEPDLFDELLGFVKREFAVVTVGQLAEQATKPKLVLSFDDGYRDFARNAVPLLKKHGLSANQNIIPNCVETGLPPLNVLTQDFIGKAPDELVARLRIEDFSVQVDDRLGHRLSHFLKMRPQLEQDRIAEELIPQFRAWDCFAPTAMMTLDEIKECGDHEIGAHSYAHASMEFETDDYLDDDIQRCAAYFRDKLARPMTIYAFPNGSCRAGQAERVLTQGVDHVLLVGERFDGGGALHTRFTFDARSPSEARFKALGGRAAA